MQVRDIPIDRITLPTELHRRALDTQQLEQLARSISDIGLINPITVELSGDHYILRAGHRRYQAHRLLRRTTITANVRDADDLAHGEVITWAENLDRSDLSPLEEAEAVKRMMDKTQSTIGATARTLHRSYDWVAERLKLLAAPDELQELVHRRELPMSFAQELARVTDEAHRAHLTHYALISGVTLPVLKDWVAQWRLHSSTPGSAPAPLPVMPAQDQPYVVMVPCLTCGTTHPAIELRIVRMCAGCLADVLQATREWREATAPATPADIPRAPNGEIIPPAAHSTYEPD